MLLLDTDEPATYAEAMSSSESKSWQDAMGSELKSMDENQVWNLVDLPDNVKASSANGSLRRKVTKTEMFRSLKLGLSRKGSDKFKELTTMRLSRPYICLSQ